jgi:hypothetical protein
MAMTNTLAYHDTATITAVKIFIVQARGVLNILLNVLAKKYHILLFA